MNPMAVVMEDLDGGSLLVAHRLDHVWPAPIRGTHPQPSSIHTASAPLSTYTEGDVQSAASCVLFVT